MLVISNICKTFGKNRALDCVSANFENSKITAVIGPNGSGKTTLIKSILGLVKPDSGKIIIGGKEVANDYRYRQAIGYMPQIAKFAENLTGLETLHLIEVIRNQKASRVDELINEFGMSPELGKKIKTLSGGTRQKLCAIVALMFDPEFLLLDEPTAGLDPISASRLKDIIVMEKARGKTVIMTSHVLSDVQQLADALVFMLDGSVGYAGPTVDLLSRTGESGLERAIAKMMQESRA